MGCRVIYLLILALSTLNKGVTTSTAIVVTPDVEVAAVGSKVKFNCNVDSKLPVWYHQESNESTRTMVYNGYVVSTALTQTHEVINTSIGQWDLTIKSVNLSHAGTYICKSANHEGGSAQLIVLNSSLRCQPDSQTATQLRHEDNDFKFKCSLDYKGNLAPGLNCSFDERLDTNLQVTNDTVPNERVTYTVTVKATKEIHGRKLTCTVNNHNVCVPNLERVADMVYTWTSDVISIAYGPHAVTIEPRDNQYKSGDKLHCHADSNPPSMYQWIDLDSSNSVQEGSELTIYQTDNISPFRYQCTATNPETKRIARDKISASIAVTELTDPHMIAVYIAGAAIGVTLILALVIVIVVKCKRSHRRHGGPDNKHNQTEVPVYAVVSHAHGRSVPDLVQNTDSLPSSKCSSRSQYANTLDLGISLNDELSSQKSKSAAIPNPAIYAKVTKSVSASSTSHLPAVTGSQVLKQSRTDIINDGDSKIIAREIPGVENGIYIVDNGLNGNDQVYELEKLSQKLSVYELQDTSNTEPTDQVYDLEKLAPQQPVYELENKSSTGSSKQMQDMQSSLNAGDGTLYAQLDLTKYPSTSTRKPAQKLIEESAYAEIDYTIRKKFPINDTI